MCCITELSLACLIKLSFVRAFIIINSLSLPYNTDLTIIFPTALLPSQRPPAFLTPPCLSIPLFWHGYEGTGCRKTLWRQQGHKSRGGQRPSSSSWLNPIGQRVRTLFSIQHGLPMVGVRSICETDWKRSWNSITVSDGNKREKSGNLIKVILDFSLHFVTDGNCFWS